MPTWTKSLRFRLALTYSSVMFVLGAMIVGGVYLALSQSIKGEPVTRNLLVGDVRQDGRLLEFEVRVVEQTIVSMERLVNERTLEQMKNISAAGLIGLFPVSVLVGWLVAGRALRPIGRITSVAREIQTTDLSRRIELDGPDDELRQLADTFDDMLDRIEEGAESQRSFIHDTSHELRNPLAIMATNLDVALSDPDAGTDELRGAAGVVRTSIDRIAKTVDDLLSYARQDIRVMASERIVVADLIEGVAADYTTAAAARQIEVATHAADGLEVNGDRAALAQAIANLVGNATRLAPMASTVTIGGGVEGEWVWIAVDDEGPGIPEHQQVLVWQRYWRADGPNRPDARRSGLGLAIVRQIAESHGGRVSLFSDDGEGSTFIIWLPVSRPPASPAPLSVRPALKRL